MQIVIGLLCDEDGQPVSIEVFPGNTQDPQTFAAQINKGKDRSLNLSQFVAAQNVQNR